MRYLLAFLACLAPLIASAQNTALETLLENQLSSEERIVEIDNFEGALTSEATMAALRVSDASGVWIELTDVRLNWNRTALFAGRLEVQELSAARVSLSRLPESEGPDVPSAEASGFSIPELPVSVQVDRLAVDRIELGAPVLGEPVVARAALSATLAGGAADISLEAERIDAQPGRALIALAFAPAEETLSLNVAVSEPAGGIVAQALSLPGLPSVELRVVGEGPLDAFEADFQLATNGQDRLAGTATLAETDGGRAFALDLAGDIRPLLEPSSRAFFGEDTALRARGEALTSGVFDLEAFSLTSAALDLAGRAVLGPGGAPELIDVTGQLGGEGPATLPGTDVTLATANLEVAFDAAVSEDWSIDLNAESVTASGLAMEALTLAGTGAIDPAASLPFFGVIEAQARGLQATDDPAVSAALGEEINVRFALSSDEEGVTNLSDLVVETLNASAKGAATVTPTEGGVTVTAALTTEAPDLSPFSELAGLALAGSALADAEASVQIPGGAIEVSLSGRTEALDLGIDTLEPLLSPVSMLTLAARRDEAGTRIEEFTLNNPELQAAVNGSVNSEDGGLSVTARLREIGLFTDVAEGPVAIEAAITDVLGERIVQGSAQAELGLETTLAGKLGGATPGLRLQGSLSEVERFAAPLTGVLEFGGDLDLDGPDPVVDFALLSEPGVSLRVRGAVSGPEQLLEVVAEVADLSALNAPLEGPATLLAEISNLQSGVLIEADIAATPEINVEIEGRPLGDAEGEGAYIDAIVTASDLGFLSPQAAGAARVEATVMDPLGQRLLAAEISSATGLTARIEGALAAPEERLEINARLASLQRFVPGLSAGANAQVTLTDLFGTPDVTANLTSDSGSRMVVAGEVGLPDGAMRLSLDGTVPLSAAEEFMSGRSADGTIRLDLDVSGQPRAENVSGTITMAEARFFDPFTGITAAPVGLDVDVAGGQADVSGTARVNGSTVRFSGTAGLLAPFPVDIVAQTQRLNLAFEDIFEGRVSAEMNLSGAVQSSLGVTGSVRLDSVEIRIPDTGLGGATEIPIIRHEGASGRVLETLSRAGLNSDGREPEPAERRDLPLDITIEAVTPMFVRGRGLDAGFDGSIDVTGTGAAPVLTGSFGLTRGRLDFLGRRLDLDSDSQIVMSGSLLPRLDIVSTTRVEEITAQIGLVGPVDEPELVLSSVPELPEDEILARVLFGRGIETLSALQVARLVNSLRTLSGAAGESYLEQARRNLGVDDLDFRSDEETGEAAVAVGANLDQNIYSEVEVGSTGNTTIQLNLDLNDSTTLRGSASSDGETGIGIFWERDY